MAGILNIAAIRAADVVGYSRPQVEDGAGAAVCSFSEGALRAGDAHDNPRGLFPQAGR